MPLPPKYAAKKTHSHTHTHTQHPSWGKKNQARLQLRVACNYRSDRRTAINVCCRRCWCCRLPQVRGTKKGDKWPLDGDSRRANALLRNTLRDICRFGQVFKANLHSTIYHIKSLKNKQEKSKTFKKISWIYWKLNLLKRENCQYDMHI